LTGSVCWAIHTAHAALTDLLDQFVLAREDGADAGGRIAVVLRFWKDGHRVNGRLWGDRQGRAVAGPQQCFDAGTKLGVACALAVQVGGTRRRVSEVRRSQEEGFRSCGIDGHGSPPEDKDEG
jgi:hypothetical protein